MKNFLLSFLSSILAISIYAQCDAPIVESWSAPSVDSITINFTPPSGAQSYILEVSGEYGLNSLGINPPLVLNGSITPGLNTVNFDASDVLFYGFNDNYYYYSARLSVICADGNTSAINQFYVSPFSLLNNPGFNIDALFFSPLTFIPDSEILPFDTITAVPIDTYITVEADDAPQEIESISVFIDLGHTYNSDLSIELISPQGTTIPLLAFPNWLGGTKGFSVVFSDGYTSILEYLPDLPLGSGPKGIFSPVEPLSDLEGENPAGVWIVRIADNAEADDGMLFGVGLIINASPCISSLSGKAYYDLNANNIQEPEEPGYNYAVIHNPLDNQDILSNSIGYYNDCSTTGSGTLSLSNTPNYYTVGAIPFTISNGESLTDLDFSIQPIPGNNDLKVDLFAEAPDRPGFNNNYIIHYQNVGTECVDNVDIHVDVDSLFLLSSSPNGDVIFLGNSADLNLSQLCPLESGSFTLSIILNDTVSLGTELISTATISPISNDQNSADNASEYHSTVVASFDPNDKTVSASTINPSFVQAGLPLKYMVRFQNTGNYLAERVLVVDTLDANLDPNSFVLTSTSHDVNITRNGNIFYFEYANIFLPDSNTSEADSHGYIRYEVKPLAGIADGETIENTANIFFDFNPPIVTNTVTTLMDFSSGVNENSFEARIFPNPAHDQINLEWLPGVRIQKINLFDLTGKKIKTYPAAGTNRAEINVEKLPAGAYLFQFIGRDVIKPVVWIKN